MYNVETKGKEIMRFLQLNQIDMYNYCMGSVDIADQLRVFYHLDHWICNRKWWWSILFWAFCVILTNLYILYTKMFDVDNDNVPKKFQYSNCHFLQEVGMYRTCLILILPTKYQLMKGRPTLHHLLLDQLSQYLLMILY